MTRRKILGLYVILSYAIIALACGAALWIEPAFPWSFLLLALGGLSTAFAGALLAKKSGKISGYRGLIKDFFGVRQPLLYYAIPLVFLLVIFGSRLWQGQLKAGQDWLAIPRLFLVAIAFGGVEEIGWRYLFQPTLEEKFSFVVSTLVTFGLWGVWHVLYFVLDGTLSTMQFADLPGFFMGLLSMSFILGGIYRVTKSLWLCVFFHAMFNALAQALVGTSLGGSVAILIFSVGVSVFLVWRGEGALRRLAKRGPTS